MAETTPSPTISLRERSFSPVGSEERLRKWFVFSLLLHLALIAGIFLSPMLPADNRLCRFMSWILSAAKELAAPIGHGVGAAAETASQEPRSLPKEVADAKKEVKKEEPQKEEKIKGKSEQRKSHRWKKNWCSKEKSKAEPVKTRNRRREVKREAKEDAKSETASADSVRERLIQGAVDRAKTRTEVAQKSSKGEALSAGSGEGEGAAALGAGGRGGPGVVKGMDFIIYQNRMLATIKENWAWVGDNAAI